ncbi:MAG: iron-sulfur cluster insertion protein ErpA [Calditrichaceae bacterium]
MITVSERAIHKLKDVIDQEQKSGWAVRVGVRGGGCSGFTYTLNLDEKPGENDQIIDLSGIKLIVDAKSIVYLAGTELDYTDGLNGSGFVFNNPNATKSCGCGSSFAV